MIFLAALSCVLGTSVKLTAGNEDCQAMGRKTCEQCPGEQKQSIGLLLFDWDNCLFPTGAGTTSTWYKWPHNIKERFLEYMEQLISEYDRELSSGLRVFLELGFEIKISSNGSPAWLRFCLNLLPITQKLLTANNAEPVSTWGSRTNLTRQELHKCGAQFKFDAHHDMLLNYLSRKADAGMIIAVGDLDNDLIPVISLSQKRPCTSRTCNRLFCPSRRISDENVYTFRMRGSNFNRQKKNRADWIGNHLREISSVLQRIRSVYEQRQAGRTQDYHFATVTAKDSSQAINIVPRAQIENLSDWSQTHTTSDPFSDVMARQEPNTSCEEHKSRLRGS